MSERTVSISGPDRWAAGIAAMAAVGGIWLALASPAHFGWWEDDAIYAVNAKSLAERGEYRHLHLPGEPWQTKYPPLYPALLSLVWRAWPAFPANLPPLQLVGAFSSALAVVLTYFLARRTLELPPGLAAAAAALTAVNPVWLALASSTMSEHVYTALSIGALACLPRPVGSGTRTPAGRGTWVRPALIGLLAGAAGLTRSVGIGLLVVVAVGWLGRRRVLAAGLSVAIAGLMLAGWFGWSRDAGRRNAEIPPAAALRYDLDYTVASPPTLASQARVAYYQAAQVPFELAALLLRPYDSFVIRSMLSPGAGTGLLAFAVLAILGLVAAGAITTWRAARPELHSAFLVCLAMTWLWPCPAQRFLVPLLPWAYCFLLAGLQATVGRLVRRPGAGGRFTLAAAAVLGLHLISLDAVNLVGPGGRRWSDQRIAWSRQLLDHTTANSVLAGGQGGYFYLLTGRKVVPLVPVASLIEYAFPDDRIWWHCGRLPSDGEIGSFERRLEERLEPYYHDAGVTHIFTSGDQGVLRAAFARVRDSRPAAFREVLASPPFRLFRVLP